MPDLQRLLQWFARQSTQRVRWTLIGLLGLWSAVHMLWLPSGSEFDRSSYDQMVKRRLFAPAADPQIVIVDIDEHSLDDMKQEFGRWPWPRETLASVLDWLNSQGARAVVFDILFADADTLNPTSDAAFVQSVQASTNTYFPVLRLHPQNDALSQVHTDQLPGFASRESATAPMPGPTVAVVPPVFDALVKSQRLGYHNIYADEDGVNRFYQLWEDQQGWRLWSLPARLALDLKWPLPEQSKVLIQFSKHKDAYVRQPFSRIWRLSQTSEGRKRDPMFKDAIVIIGATATSLFDVKVTPLATTHPGVMVLANVIDNLKQQQFLRQVPAWVKVLVAWLGLLLMAWASQKIREDQMKWAVPAAPGLFLGLGYLGLNSGMNLHLDLTPSASHALLFFSAWTLYLNWRVRYFVRPLSTTPALADASLESFAVLKMAIHSLDMGEILDRLPSNVQACTAVHLGALGRLPHEQPGLVYVALWTDPGESGPRLLEQMIGVLPQKPLATYLGAPRGPHLLADRYWDKLWEDVAEARLHWRTA